MIFTKKVQIFQVVEMHEEGGEEDDIDEEGTPDGAHVLSLKLLPLVRSLQGKHGLRHGDHPRRRNTRGRVAVFASFRRIAHANRPGVRSAGHLD